MEDGSSPSFHRSGVGRPLFEPEILPDCASFRPVRFLLALLTCGSMMVVTLHRYLRRYESLVAGADGDRRVLLAPCRRCLSAVLLPVHGWIA